MQTVTEDIPTPSIKDILNQDDYFEGCSAPLNHNPLSTSPHPPFSLYNRDLHNNSTQLQDSHLQSTNTKEGNPSNVRPLLLLIPPKRESRPRTIRTTKIPEFTYSPIDNNESLQLSADTVIWELPEPFRPYSTIQFRVPSASNSLGSNYEAHRIYIHSQLGGAKSFNQIPEPGEKAFTLEGLALDYQFRPIPCYSRIVDVSDNQVIRITNGLFCLTLKNTRHLASRYLYFVLHDTVNSRVAMTCLFKFEDPFMLNLKHQALTSTVYIPQIPHRNTTAALETTISTPYVSGEIQLSHKPAKKKTRFTVEEHKFPHAGVQFWIYITSLPNYSQYKASFPNGEAAFCPESIATVENNTAAWRVLAPTSNQEVVFEFTEMTTGATRTLIFSVVPKKKADQLNITRDANDLPLRQSDITPGKVRVSFPGQREIDMEVKHYQDLVEKIKESLKLAENTFEMHYTKLGKDFPIVDQLSLGLYFSYNAYYKELSTISVVTKTSSPKEPWYFTNDSSVFQPLVKQLAEHIWNSGTCAVRTEADKLANELMNNTRNSAIDSNASEKELFVMLKAEVDKWKEMAAKALMKE